MFGQGRMPGCWGPGEDKIGCLGGGACEGDSVSEVLKGVDMGVESRWGRVLGVDVVVGSEIFPGGVGIVEQMPDADEDGAADSDLCFLLSDTP